LRSFIGVSHEEGKRRDTYSLHISFAVKEI
jgi:hypothetical protein